MPYTIRSITAEDRETVRSILMEAWSSTEFASSGDLVDALEVPGYLAFEGGNVMGLLTWYQKDRVCELLTLNALQKGRGIGTGLIDHFLREIAELDLERVFLMTTNDNIDAIAFYQRRGWVLTDLNAGAVTEARRTRKPSIPRTGHYGLPIRDELVIEPGPDIWLK